MQREAQPDSPRNVKHDNHVYEFKLSSEDLDVLTRALWDLAALHSTYPRPHLDRLHALRRYLLAVQVPRLGGEAWATALPALPSESP